jgi:hypothetical protein
MTGGDTRRGRARGLLVAVALGIAAAIVWTFPLAVRSADSITTALPCTGCVDTVLSMWIVGESGRRLYGDPLHLFDANAFHPLRHTLAYSESMLAAGAVVAPLHALSGNPILAFNLYFLATLVLCFVGMFLLVREITGDVRAALLAGLLFAFLGDRWKIPDHLPAQSIQWIPFVLYFWIRCLSTATWGSALGLGLAIAANLLHSVYYGLTLPVLLVPWAAVLLASRSWPLGSWVRVGIVVAVASLASLWAYLPYFEVQAELRYRQLGFGFAPLSWYWGAFSDPAAYVADLFSDRRRPPAVSPLALVLLALAGLAMLVRRPAPAAKAGERVHAVALAAFYLAAVLLSLGRTIDVAGIAVPGPFRILNALPGFGSFRGTSRLLIFASFASTALAGMAMAALLRRLRSRAAVAVATAALAAVIAIDTRLFAGPWPLTRLVPPDEVPPVYRWLASTPPETAVLELPYGPWGDDVRAMFLSLYHGRRLVNGYSAVIPFFGEVLLRFPEEIAVRALQDAGVSYVLAHRDRLRSDPVSARRLAEMEKRADLAPRWIGSTLVLTIPPASRSVDERVGRRLDRGGWKIVGISPGAARAIDGDLATHWLTRRRGGFLRVDLGSTSRIERVVLRMGKHVLEYPPRYELRTSIDGKTWSRAGASAPATLPPFASYRRDHHDVEVPLQFEPVEARHLEIRVPPAGPIAPSPSAQRSESSSAWAFTLLDPDALATDRPWGVHELEVYASSPGES